MLCRWLRRRLRGWKLSSLIPLRPVSPPRGGARPEKGKETMPPLRKPARGEIRQKAIAILKEKGTALEWPEMKAALQAEGLEVANANAAAFYAARAEMRREAGEPVEAKPDGKGKGRSAILKAIAKAGAEDLVAIRERLEELEREVKTLRTVESILEAKLGPGGDDARSTPPPAAAPPAPPARPAAPDPPKSARPEQIFTTEQYRLRLAKYLLAGGPVSPDLAGRAMQIPGELLYGVLHVKGKLHEWFSEAPGSGKLSLTAGGQIAARQKQS